MCYCTYPLIALLSLPPISALPSLTAAEDGEHATSNNQPYHYQSIWDSISINGVVVIFLGVVYTISITDPLYGGIIVLHIEQLNEVEMDLERFDRSTDKQSHPR